MAEAAGLDWRARTIGSADVRTAAVQAELQGLQERQTVQALPRPAAARGALHQRFARRLIVRRGLNRRLVSYQANKAQPGLRWLRYKEGFSAQLVREALREADGPVLDPFAGIGTTALVAAGAGRQATAIELMPVGVRTARAIVHAANDVYRADIEAAGAQLLAALHRGGAPETFRFPHVPITQHAFPPAAEDALAAARAFLAGCGDPVLRIILDTACMSVLEEVSYTRKDGQYLRWDSRCARQLRGGMHKGPIPSVAQALERRLAEMAEDAPQLRARCAGATPRLLQGSALRDLALLPDASFGLTVTSPPYANRYDYTRTYALELAWLGYDRAGFGRLRQALLSATVENRAKTEQLDRDYPRPDVLARARAAVGRQAALAEALHELRRRRSELGNPNVIALVENYFLEMALVVAELARVTRPGGRVVMVNDNVQYHGQEVPVDLILADIAEACGLHCEEISVLPRGKGNASQQMARFGRRELRKCVYHWRKPAAHSDR